MPLRNRKHFSVVFVVLTFIVLFATPEYGSLPVPYLRGKNKIGSNFTKVHIWIRFDFFLLGTVPVFKTKQTGI